MGKIVDDHYENPFKRRKLYDNYEKQLIKESKERRKKKKRRKSPIPPLPEINKKIEKKIHVPTRRHIRNALLMPAISSDLTQKMEKELQVPTKIQFKWYGFQYKRTENLPSANKIEEIKEKKKTDYEFRIAVIGDSLLGKTNLMRRYKKVFKNNIKTASGADVAFTLVELQGKKIKLQIWDIAEEERFKVLLPAYLREANGVILMFDFIKAKLLNLMFETIDIIRQNAGDIPILLAIAAIPFKAKSLENFNEKYEFTELTPEIGPDGDQIIELLTEKMLKHSE